MTLQRIRTFHFSGCHDVTLVTRLRCSYVTVTYFVSWVVNFQWETCGKRQTASGFAGGAEAERKRARAPRILPLPRARRFAQAPPR